MPTASASPAVTSRSALADFQTPWDAEIPFMAADEFEDLSYADDELELVRELTSGVAAGTSGTHIDPLLGQLVARSAPLLSAEEERILFRRMNYVRFQAEAVRSALSPTRKAKKKLVKLEALMQEAGTIRRRLAESNLRLVVSITRKYARSAHQFQDFLSDGLLILLGAIEKFDYSRGFRFSTYATHSIQRHFFRLSQRDQRHAQRFVPTPGEVMTEVAIVEEPEEERAHESATLYRQLMESAKERLNEREESILHRRFGTDGRHVTQTLREVAFDLGISKERVRQIQIAALRKLKDAALELNLMPTAG